MNFPLLSRRPTDLDAHRTLNLRMKNIHFTNHEIDACAVID